MTVYHPQVFHNNSKLVMILGDRGSGKSLLLARFLLKSSLPMYANFKVFASAKDKDKDELERELHPRYNELHPEELLHLNVDGANVGITEAYEYFESRLGMGAFQRYMSYITFQTRKRKLSVFIDTQLDDTIDHRFTRLCDYLIIAEAQSYGFKYYVSNKKFIKEFVITFEQAEKFWDLYNSWEVIVTPQMEDLGKQVEVQNKPKLKVKLAELSEKFYDKYGDLEKKKITHKLVEYFLLDCEESDVYADFLHAKLQEPTPRR